MRPIVPFVKKQPHGSVIDDKTSVIRSRITAILLMIGLFMLNQAGYSQTANQYGFSTVGTASLVLDRNTNTVNMTTGTTQLIGSSVDDQGSSVTNIGFTFTYFGTAYTQFSASSNGGIRLGGSAISGNTIGTSFPVSNQAIIAPYLQDIETNSTGKVHYKVIGTAPNRTLVVEFLNMRINFASSAANGTFQARLYERTNIIEFVYGAMAVGSTSNGGGSNADARNAVIGFSNTTGANNEFSVNQSSPYTTTTSSSPIVNVNGSTGNIAGLNSAADGLRRSFTFIPPTVNTSAISGSPFCPGAAVSVPFTSSGVFTSNTYTAQLSTATGSFTGATTIGTLVSNANSGTINGFIDAGAIAGSLYRIRVISSNSNVLSFDNNTNLTVNANPAVSGPTAVCVGGTTTVTPTSGGTWGSSDNGIATVTDAGEVNGVLAGNATLTFTSTATGCTNTVALTVNGNATLGLTSIGGTDAQTLCVNTPLINITYLVGGTGTGASITAGFLPAGVTGTYNGGTKIFTIQGTPTASGSFSYTLTTTGPCGNVSLSGTITVTAASDLTLTSGAGSNTPTVCIGNAINDITYATGGTATGASITAGTLPAGVTGSYDGDLGVFTITGVPTASGTFNFTVTSAGPCPVSRTGTINVTANSTLSLLSVAGTDAQTKCIGTAITNITYLVAGGGTGASITAGALPAGVTGSYNSGTKIFTIQGTPTVSGSFSYTLTTTGPCVNTSLSGTIDVTAASDLTLTSGAGTNIQTVCIDNAINNITYSIGGTATGASLTAGSFPAGVTGNFNGDLGIFTISGEPTASGTFNFTITSSGPCPVSRTGTITVNANSTLTRTSGIGTDAQTKCISTAITPVTYLVAAGGTGASITAGALPAGVTGTYNGGSKVFTIQGTPTVSGSFNYTVTTTGPCINASLSGTITVTANSTLSLTSGAGSNLQTLCQNTAINTITYAVGGSATGANVSGLPAGVTSVYESGVLTISGTPTVSGSFNFTVATTGPCVNPSLNGTIAVNPAPVVGLAAAPGSVCFTQSAVITATNSGGTTSQVFSGTGAGVAIPDWSAAAYTYSTINLAAGSETLTSADVLQVTLNISHGNDADLDIFLVDPSGTRAMLLSSDNGGSGNDYFNTVLSTSAANIIGSTGNNSAPFTGTFRPEGTITTAPDRTGNYIGGNYNAVVPGNALNGAPITGSWSLRIFDDGFFNSGSLTNWSLSITKAPVAYTTTFSGPATIVPGTPTGLNTTATATVTAAVGPNSYTATTTDALGCSATSLPVVVTVNPVPDAPVSGGNQTVCEDGNPLQTLTATATGENVTWYATATGGGTVSPVQVGPGTSTYFAEASNGLCASLTRTPVTLTINAAPAAPTASNQTVCSDGNPSQTLTATATGGTITWYDAALLGTVVPSPTQVGVGSVTYYAEANNGTCNSLTLTPVTLTINAVPDAPVSGGNQAVCEDGNPLQTLTATATGDNVTWYAAATGGGTVSPVQVGPGTSTYYAEASNGLCASLTRTPVTLTINAAPAAPTASNQTVCSDGNPTQTLTATATGGTITWYDAALLGSVVPSPTKVGVGTVTYHAEAFDGTCSSLTLTPVTLTINAVPDAPVSGGNQAVCEDGNPLQTLTATATGDNVTWYAAATGGGTVSPVQVGPGTSTYYAEASNGLCASLTRTPVTLTINAAPAAPTASNQSVCSNGNPLQTLTATATGGAITWYDEATNGNVVPVPTQVGVGAATYYAESSDGTCNSLTRTAVTLKINIPPAVPGPISGPVNVCPFANPVVPITYSIAPVPFAETYRWVLPVTVNLISASPDSTSITITLGPGFNDFPNKQIRVRSISSCGNSAERIFYMRADFPITPSPITGPSNICSFIESNTEATYVIPKVTAATAYIWTIPAGATATHPNGPGANDTIVTLSFGPTFVTSPITVRSTNDCGTSSARSFTIVRILPSTPGLITGPTNVCEYIAPLGGYGLYKIRKVPGVTSYTWTVPAGANMTHQNDPGVNDTAILVNFPANFNNGAISVISHNGCGTSVSPRFLSVGKLNPATPGMIDVIQLATCPNRQYSYTIANMPANATNVQWTVPASAVSFTGQGTTSIIVEYPSSTINGNVTATAYSNCGNSVTRAMQVKLPACPPPPPPAPFTGKPTVVEPGKPAGTETIPATMGVSIYPNPSTAAFNVQVITAGKELVKVRIMDLQGRTFKQISVAPFQKTTFGNELKAGTYIVEIIQGKDRITQKIVKL